MWEDVAKGAQPNSPSSRSQKRKKKWRQWIDVKRRGGRGARRKISSGTWEKVPSSWKEIFRLKWRGVNKKGVRTESTREPRLGIQTMQGLPRPLMPLINRSDRKIREKDTRDAERKEGCG